MANCSVVLLRRVLACVLSIFKSIIFLNNTLVKANSVGAFLINDTLAEKCSGAL